MIWLKIIWFWLVLNVAGRFLSDGSRPLDRRRLVVLYVGNAIKCGLKSGCPSSFD